MHMPHTAKAVSIGFSRSIWKVGKIGQYHSKIDKANFSADIVIALSTNSTFEIWKFSSTHG